MKYNRYNNQYSFANVPNVQVQRSKFDRSHNVKTTFNSGNLIPIYIDEVLPGDTFDVDVAHVTRTATPIVPVMDNLHQDFHFFFVPYRLLYENWERLCGSRDNPDDSIDYLVPQISSGDGWTNSSLAIILVCRLLLLV